MTVPDSRPRLTAGTQTLLEQIQAKVAIADPEHLKAWLVQSGRTWLVFRTADLVDALPWPEGVESLIGLVECYRQHRAARPPVAEPDGTFRHLGDALEADELEEAIAFLQDRLAVRRRQDAEDRRIAEQLAKEGGL